MIRRRQWLIIALCFCAFTGCVSCQSNYDYCGPMPDEGGDFMYRKNSILGGDPSMPRADQSTGEQGEEGGETESGPEPTPAPAPDETPTPGIDIEGDEDLDMAPADGDPQAYEELPEDADEEAAMDADEEGIIPASGESVTDEGAGSPVSTLDWHAPAKKQKESPIQQVRFR